MIASLPMYDRPSNRAAHDALWALVRDGLRDSGIAAPDALDRDVPYRATWARPDLVLGQICCLPYQADHMGRVTVIGASDYGLSGCAPGYFTSVFVARADDPREAPAAFADARFVANGLHSHSGYRAAQLYAHARGFRFRAPAISGAHDASVCAVAEGRADIAAIDAQTWRMQRHDLPQAAALRELGVTDPAPGITFITRSAHDPALFRAAIGAALAALAEDDRAVLGLRGVTVLPAAAYDLPLAPAA